MLTVASRGGLPTHRPQAGLTPLHVAVKAANVPAAAELVEAGADLDAGVGEGGLESGTALHLAVFAEGSVGYESQELIDGLLSVGANPAVYDRQARGSCSAALTR